MVDLLTCRTLVARGAGFVASAIRSRLAASAQPGLSSVHPMTTNASRAVNAYDAMQKHFYVAGQKLYRENYPHNRGGNSYSYLWPFEEAAKATLYMYGLPGGASAYARAIQDRLVGREAYWDRQADPRGYHSYPRTGDKYYDDNCWVGSDFLQHHLMTGDAAALDRARRVFNFVATGWEDDPNSFQKKPGGVFWVQATFNRDRGTDPTGGFAKLGAHLYDATGRTTGSYLEWAKRAYEWTQTWLLAPDGLYWDNILPDADESVATDQWIYNQGIMIGASVLLHRVTGDLAYRQEAVRLADAALASYGTDRYHSGGRGSYSGQAIFNAIFWRNLLMLYGVTNNPAYLQKMQAYADDAWNDRDVHDASTGLFKLDSASSTYSLLDQAAMVQVYACLAWEPSSYKNLT